MNPSGYANNPYASYQANAPGPSSSSFDHHHHYFPAAPGAAPAANSGWDAPIPASSAHGSIAAPSGGAGMVAPGTEWSRDPLPNVTIPELQPFTPDHFESYQPMRIFHELTSHVTSLAFDDSGELLAATGDDDNTLYVINCLNGTLAKTCPSKKYGCHLARFVHKNPNHVLFASTKPDGKDIVRLVDTEKNGFLRYFRGHSGLVTSIEVSPVVDVFVTASLDETVRVWDVRSDNCQGVIKMIPGKRGVASVDPTGKVIAVVSQDKQPGPGSLPLIHLFDSRNFDSGPFETQPIYDPTHDYRNQPAGAPYPLIPPITQIRFSPDATACLLTTAHNVHYVMDTFNCASLAKIGSPLATSTSPTAFGSAEADFAPDSKHLVMANAEDGGNLAVYTYPLPDPRTGEGKIDQAKLAARPPAWRARDTRAVCQMDYVGNAPMQRVAFNHALDMFASVSGKQLCFWAPEAKKGF